VNYEEKKNLLRELIKSTVTGEVDQRDLLTSVVTDKLMAEDFNRNFYKGIGQTSSNQLSELIEFNIVNVARAILRNGIAIVFALWKLTFGFSRPSDSSSIGWVYGLPSHYFSSLVNLEKLSDFLDEKNSEQGLAPPVYYLIQSSLVRPFESTDRVKVVPHIGLAILRNTHRSKSNLLFETLARTSKWVSMSIRNPILWRIGMEYVIDLQAVNIRRFANDSLMTTQTHLLNPPIAFKSDVEWPKIMYWYSDNGRQILGNETSTDYGYLKIAEICTHYVWTNSWASILAAQNKHAKIVAIGPIIFSNLDVSRTSFSQDGEKYRKILIFDVTPKKNADSQSIYSEEIMQEFVKDIIQACEESQVGLSLYLKPKRKYSSHDSKRYIEFLSEVGNKVTTLQWDCDFQSEIKSSALVICIPFTSPALISKFLGVPCIFYSPQNGFVFEKHYEGIAVIQGKDQLVAWLLENSDELLSLST
jgi:hypothetical protein